MPLYTVKTDSAWIPNGFGRPELRVHGEDVVLTEDQAEYLILAGQIVLAGDYIPVAPAPLQPNDVIILQRGNHAEKLELEQFPAFFAPVLGNGNGSDPTEAFTLSPLVLSFLAI